MPRRRRDLWRGFLVERLTLLNYPWHFALLALMAALLAITIPLRPAPGVGLGVAVYGALHAAALVATLKDRRPGWRQAAFVVGAAILCVLAARLGIYGLRFVRALPNVEGPLLMLALAAGAGALAYGILIRSVLNFSFPPLLMLLTSSGCVVATLAAFVTGRSYPGLGGLWLAVAWWFAFSGGLRYAERSGAGAGPTRDPAGTRDTAQGRDAARGRDAGRGRDEGRGRDAGRPKPQ
jgi:hypothetical protein